MKRRYIYHFVWAREGKTRAVSTDKQNFVVDMHSDIATDISIRRERGERGVFKKYHYNKLVNSGIRGLFSVLWVEPEYRGSSVKRLIQLLGSLLADIRECADCVEIVDSADGLTKVAESEKIGLFLGVEGMTFVEQWPQLVRDLEVSQGSYSDSETLNAQGELEERLLESLSILQPLGLKHAILAWGEDNQIASGPIPGYEQPTNRGLTSFGTTVVQELQRRKILVDVSHLDDASIDMVFEQTVGLVIASHSNARAICNVPRNLIDVHIDEIGRRQGVIGINAYPDFIDGSNPGIDQLINHIVYIAGRIGIEHLAFGFDFTDFMIDGGEGWKRDHVELKSAADVPKLLNRMRERQFSELEIEKIAFRNVLRVMESIHSH